jgi:hypothetical protein
MPPTNIMQFQDYAEGYALGLTMVYEDDLKQHPKSWGSWLREETVKRFYDTDWVTSGLSTMPEKAIGGTISTDKILKGPTKQYGLTPYAVGVIIEYEAMRWEIHGIFDGLGQEMSKSAVNRYNVVTFSLFNNSFTAPNANYQTFQGETIIDTAHTRLDGGSWSNQDSTNPGLSYLAIQQSLIDYTRLVNERGLYVQLAPQTLVTAPENEYLANEILGSSTRPDQSNPGVINTVRGKVKVVTSPFITSTTAWWMIANKSDVRMKLRLGDKPRMEKDIDYRNKNLFMSSYCSFALAVFDSRGWWGSTG